MEQTPQLHQVKILDKQQLSAEMFLITTSRPEGFSYRSGQFAGFIFEDEQGEFIRSYSFMSVSTEPQLLFLIKPSPNGRSKPILDKLRRGSELTFRGPFGNFRLRDLEHDMIMVATGTGLAPIYSMIVALIALKYQGQLTLYFGARAEEGLVFVEKLGQLFCHHSNLRLVITLTQPPKFWSGATGRVTEHLKKHACTGQEDVYVCGSQAMVGDITQVLQEAHHFPPEQIITESYL